MTIKQILRNIFLLLLVLANVGCDQISKHIARTNLSYHEEVKVISNHFILTKVENSGAFLSIGNNLPTPIKLFFFSILPLAVLSGGIYYLLQNKNIPVLLAVGIAFTLGGGIGNLYDRILHGSVTDFMHINFSFIKTGIFNMADVSIMIGMGLILIHLVSKKNTNISTSNSLAE